MGWLGAPALAQRSHRPDHPIAKSPDRKIRSTPLVQAGASPGLANDPWIGRAPTQRLLRQSDRELSHDCRPDDPRLRIPAAAGGADGPEQRAALVRVPAG